MIDSIVLMLSTILLGLIVYWSFVIKRQLKVIRESIALTMEDSWNSALLMRNIPEGVLPTAPNGWAAGSDLLVQLLKIIKEQRPTSLVELGSGLSTLVIGLELKRQGFGKLISIEHDPDYGAETMAHVVAAGISDYVEVRITSLTAKDGHAAPWYNRELLDDIQQVDLVFVDGPPGIIASRIREQALPFFWPRLGSGGQIVFDDANRSDEHTFIVEWAASHPDCAVQWLPVAKGCAVFRRST